MVRSLIISQSAVTAVISRRIGLYSHLFNPHLLLSTLLRILSQYQSPLSVVKSVLTAPKSILTGGVRILTAPISVLTGNYIRVRPK